MGRVVVHNGGAGDMPFVVGTYQGDGSERRTIDLGFQPSAVIVWRYDGVQSDGWYRYGGMAMPGYPCSGVQGGQWYQSAIQVTASGFEVYYQDSSSYHYNTNHGSFMYYYMAFRP